jgi:anti-sigma factor (TIGR02949 family)
MTCDDARQLIDAHLDHELDAARDQELIQHLRECSRCTREADSIREIKTALREQAPYFNAPGTLRRKITQAAGSSSGGAGDSARWFRRSAAILVPAALAAMLTLFLAPRSGQSDFLAREIVAAHVRSMQVDHLTDVASTDRHTVKPWFEGKLDFSPPVADYQAQGFKLDGGRVDYLDNRTVAALVYTHGPHVINVFIWPASESERAPMMTIRSGYNLDRFVHAGMNYWIVSDMSEDEMQKLAALLRG